MFHVKHMIIYIEGDEIFFLTIFKSEFMKLNLNSGLIYMIIINEKDFK